MVHQSETPHGGAHGASKTVQIGVERSEATSTLTRLQRLWPTPSRSADLARQYRDAAIRNHRAAVELGGRAGYALAALANHYSRRAAEYDLRSRGAA